MLEEETQNFCEGELSEAAQLGRLDEYDNVEILGDVRGLFNAATITSGADGQAVLNDTPNITCFLPTWETVAGGQIGAQHVVIVRGKMHPVRIEPRANAHGLANIELRKAV